MKKMTLSMMTIMATLSVAFAPAAFATTTTDGVNLSATVNETMTLACGADVNLGSFTPLTTQATGSTVCTAGTNGGGYTISVIRDDATSTMDRDASPTTDMPDLTAWDNTASAGSGNAATWVNGTTAALGFTVFASTASKNNTWWGAGTTATDALNEYAGFPAAHAASTVIMDHSTYSGTTTTTSIGYKLDAPVTQRAGAYSGSITYQATSKP